jgi:hypothetical protein
MLRKLGWAGALGAGVVGVVLIASQANASVIWDGDAARGNKNAVFGIDNCPSPGSIAPVKDASRGAVWRFTKPAKDKRCEAHGIKVDGEMFKFSNNSTYYMAWESSLSSTTDNNAVFQWKSYGKHIQNFPLVLKMQKGKLTLLNRQPEGKTFLPFAKEIKADTVTRIVLGIHTSDELMGGWAELFLNGEQQTFTNGEKRWPCRTWDDHNDPKWGVYGAEKANVTNVISGLKIGTTLEDVT